SGLIMTPRSLTMALMSTVSSFFLIRFGYRLPMIIGTLLISSSLFLMSGGYHNANLLGLHIPDLAFLALVVVLAGLGMGVSAPAANNAALELVPGKVAAAAGICGMFRSVGGVMGTATIVLALSHFSDKAVGAQQVFFALAILILAVIPFIMMIPDTARQRHLRTRETTPAKKEAPPKS
ncbi:MAG: MFS transporter, partial [Chloroflexota bacterium]